MVTIKGQAPHSPLKYHLQSDGYDSNAGPAPIPAKDTWRSANHDCVDAFQAPERAQMPACGKTLIADANRTVRNSHLAQTISIQSLPDMFESHFNSVCGGETRAGALRTDKIIRRCAPKKAAVQPNSTRIQTVKTLRSDNRTAALPMSLARLARW